MDISELKQLEENLIIAKNAAESANTAKSQFLANMSHEIRTPMNAIIGFASILASLETEPRKKEFIDSIRSSGQALLHLINDILDLSKIEAGKMTVIPAVFAPDKMADDLHRLFQPRLNEKQLGFTLEIDPRLPKALIGDQIRLRQIIINLVGNAIKFTERGQISLCLRQIGRDNELDRIDLEIQVRDSGIGVAEADRERIFQAFEQSNGQDHARYGGTGLGLSITHRLVSLMGGRIRVEPNQPQGSVFIVELPGLPVALALADKLGSGSDRAWQYRFFPARILIADDVPLNQVLLRAYLENQPIEILEAADGEEALEKIHRLKPDLVITDIKMPRLSGDRLAAILHAETEYSHLPVLAVTASVMSSQIEAIRPIFAGILQKPVSQQDLFQLLAEFLPHEKDSRLPDEASPASNGEFHGHDTAKLRTALAKLAEEFPLLSKSSRISLIKQYAARLEELAAFFQAAGLHELADNLSEAVRVFNVDRIKETLESIEDYRRSMAS